MAIRTENKAGEGIGENTEGVQCFSTGWIDHSYRVKNTIHPYQPAIQAERHLIGNPQAISLETLKNGVVGQVKQVGF